MHTLEQFLRYNAVGIANTIVGLGIIFILMFMGFTPTVSNLIGYMIGAILSYVLNSHYTFNSEQKSLSQVLKFFTVLLIAYILNYLVLQYTLTFVNAYFAQLLSAVVYTLTSFFLMKIFVFKK